MQYVSPKTKIYGIKENYYFSGMTCWDKLYKNSQFFSRRILIFITVEAIMYNSSALNESEQFKWCFGLI